MYREISIRNAGISIVVCSREQQRGATSLCNTSVQHLCCESAQVCGKTPEIRAVFCTTRARRVSIHTIHMYCTSSAGSFSVRTELVFPCDWTSFFSVTETVFGRISVFFFLCDARFLHFWRFASARRFLYDSSVLQEGPGVFMYTHVQLLPEKLRSSNKMENKGQTHEKEEKRDKSGCASIPLTKFIHSGNQSATNTPSKSIEIYLRHYSERRSDFGGLSPCFRLEQTKRKRAH